MNNHWRKRIIEASCLDKKEDDDNINMNNNNKKKLDENRISPVKNTNKDVSNKPNGEKNGTVSSNFTQNSTIIAVSSNQQSTNNTNVSKQGSVFPPQQFPQQPPISHSNQLIIPMSLSKVQFSLLNNFLSN